MSLHDRGAGPKHPERTPRAIYGLQLDSTPGQNQDRILARIVVVKALTRRLRLIFWGHVSAPANPKSGWQVVSRVQSGGESEGGKSHMENHPGVGVGTIEPSHA